MGRGMLRLRVVTGLRVPVTRFIHEYYFLCQTCMRPVSHLSPNQVEKLLWKEARKQFGSGVVKLL